MTGCIPWLLTQKLTLDISHDQLTTCLPSVEEGGKLFLESSILLASDADPRNDNFGIVAVESAVNGAVMLDGTIIVFQHDGSETTEAGFSYTVSDGLSQETESVMIAVSPANDRPEATGDTVQVDEGHSVSMGASILLANDTDSEEDQLYISAVGDAVNGRVLMDGLVVVYIHDGSETTEGSFSYTVSDGLSTDTALVTVSVLPVNDRPAPAEDYGTVDEGESVAFENLLLLKNDADPDGDRLTITAVGNVVNGSAIGDGSTIVFTHDGSETTEASFTYTVSDGIESSNTRVLIAVAPVNDPPVPTSDAGVVLEGESFTVEVWQLLENDRDPERDQLTVVAVGDGVNGLAVLDGTTVTYTHDGSQTVGGSFSYTVSDGQDFDDTTVALKVVPVNDPPKAVEDDFVVQEGGSISLEAPQFLANDTDEEEDALTMTAVGQAENGAVFLDGATVIYKHDGSESPKDSFSYSISDGEASATGAVSISVLPVNDPPVANRDAGQVREGSTLSWTSAELLANDTDADNDSLVIVSVADAVNGEVSLNGETVSYNHDGTETTSGTFSYIVTDGLATSTATVSLTVLPVNDAPSALADMAAVDEGKSVVLNASDLLANDIDPEGDTLILTAVGEPVNGMVALEAPVIIYSHDGSETNTGSFSYTVSDGSIATTTTVVISVSQVNDPPVALDDRVTVEKGERVSVEAPLLLANDSDVENDFLVVTAVGSPTNGRVFLADTTVIYEHDGSGTEVGSFNYTVSDGTAVSTATVVISVESTNVWVYVFAIGLIVGIVAFGAIIVVRKVRRA